MSPGTDAGGEEGRNFQVPASRRETCSRMARAVTCSMEGGTTGREGEGVVEGDGLGGLLGRRVDVQIRRMELQREMI